MRSVVVSMLRFPRNAAYCAAWNSGFLTTFRWSSGSRNERGEMAHSDALTHRLACYLLKGQPRRSGRAPMISGLPRREDKFRTRRASNLCHQEIYAQQQLAAHSITSSGRASSGADRETKRLAGCKLAASQKLVGNSIGKSLSAAPRG